MGSSQSSFIMGTTCHQMFLVTKTMLDARMSPLSQVLGGAGLSLGKLPEFSSFRSRLRAPGFVSTSITWKALRGIMCDPNQMAQGGVGEALIETGKCLLPPTRSLLVKTAISRLSQTYGPLPGSTLPIWCQCCYLVCFQNTSVAISI